MAPIASTMAFLVLVMVSFASAMLLLAMLKQKIKPKAKPTKKELTKATMEKYTPKTSLKTYILELIGVKPVPKLHKFPELPVEIRVKIWQLAATSPRIMTVAGRMSVILSPYSNLPYKMAGNVYCAPPPIFHGNRESRAVAMRHYEATKTNQDHIRGLCWGNDTFLDPVIHFNFVRDTLFIADPPALTEWFSQFVVPCPAQPDHPYSHMENNMMSIRYVAIGELCHCHMVKQVGEFAEVLIAKIINHFINVQEVFMVQREDHHDFNLEAWASLVGVELQMLRRGTEYGWHVPIRCVTLQQLWAMHGYK